MTDEGTPVDEVTAPDDPEQRGLPGPQELVRLGQSDPRDESVELEPAHDPSVEAQVQALLASAPAPPMPAFVAERVLLALRAERSGVGGARVPEAPVREGSDDHDVLAPLVRQRQRPRPLLAAAAVAAAAAVVAVGASTLHLTTRPEGSAVAVVGSAPQGGGTGTPLSADPTDTRPRVHLQLSPTAYDAGTLASKARALLSAPGPPLREEAATPSLGPIATGIGLASCLEALGQPDPDSVIADLATYGGEPAAIIVVTADEASTAYAVRRSCTSGDGQVLHDATPVP